MKPCIAIFVFCLVLCSEHYGQNNISLKYFGLTIHPFGDQLADIQPYRLDPNAHFVLNFGGFAKYEHFVWEDILALDVAQAIFSDCSAGLSTVTSIGIHALVFEKRNHQLFVDMGPTLFIRRDWNRFEAYKDDGTYNQFQFRNKSWQYGIYPVSLMVEYNTKLNENYDFSVSAIPYPVIALGFGLRYWFSRTFQIKEELILPN